MGKRKVLNESALKEIRLPEEGELFGRVIKLLGSDLLDKIGRASCRERV